MSGSNNPHFNKKGSNQWASGDYVISDETRRKLSEAVLSRSDEFNKSIGKKISDTVNRKVREGTWHTSLAKNMHYEYNGVDLHGTWELNFAIWLDENDIEWVRCKDRFEYYYENRIRRYTPDFYLPSYDKYIEIKGYKTDKDVAKWRQFPQDKDLEVLRESELKELAVI